MIEQNIHPAENERMSTLKKESFQGKNCLPTFIFEERALSYFGSTMAHICLKMAWLENSYRLSHIPKFGDLAWEKLTKRV